MAKPVSRNHKVCNPKPSFRSSLKNGFTLIELIIVLLIIGIVSGLVGIMIKRGAGGLELKAFTKNVSATLRYARNHAAAEKKVYSFIIWKDKRAYGLYSDLSFNEDLEEAVPAVYKAVPESLQLIYENHADYLRIDFFPGGNSSGGMVEISDQKEDRFFIIVNRVTGRVTVEKSQISD